MPEGFVFLLNPSMGYDKRLVAPMFGRVAAVIITAASKINIPTSMVVILSGVAAVCAAGGLLESGCFEILVRPEGGHSVTDVFIFCFDPLAF